MTLKVMKGLINSFYHSNLSTGLDKISLSANIIKAQFLYEINYLLKRIITWLKKI